MASVHTYTKGFDKTINALKRTGANVTQKHVDTATRAGIAVISRRIRKLAPVLGDGNKGLKKAVGGKVGKDKLKGVRVAKAGIAVGKKPSKIVKQNRNGRPGVGISAQNAHWFILGAGLNSPKRPSKKFKRERAENRPMGRYTKDGRYTGVMQPIANNGFVYQGFMQSKDEAAQKMHDVLYAKVLQDFKQ